ncbi:hypothetical protein SSX86_023619 [Deinandra increscens subsp. villosa]|uniref:F-box domain-containing protein n=1 Tax=Deinandra increscens subsp. villosa TaxID=3103831 RepID=A0AAP0CMM0_9ASTR
MEEKQVSCDEKLPTVIAENQHYQYYQCNELKERRIRGCFHYWVILSDHQDDILWSLWNPIASKLIRLPPLKLRKEEEESYECCLSSPPDDEASVFLLFSDSVPTIVFCRLDRKRKGLKWTEMSYAKQLRSISNDANNLGCLGPLGQPTCWNGKVYAIDFGDYMSVVHVDIVVKPKEVVISLFPFVEMPRVLFVHHPARVRSYIRRPFLKGTCIDLLFYIQVDFRDEMIDDVHLLKLDVTSMMWKEVVELEDAVLFIEIDDDNYSTCYYSSAPGSKLRGYVHIFCESRKVIYSFHAKDRTLSLSSMSPLLRECQALAWPMLESKREEQDEDAKVVVRPVKGENNVFDSTTSGHSHLLNMPLDILELIMKHCVSVEYMKFRATCKHCYLAAPSIQWSNKTMLRRLHSYSLVSPWLMAFDNHRGIITFIDPLFGDKYYIKTPQELSDGDRIYCSRYGWLLMYKVREEVDDEEGERLMFFNPFTSNIIELPVVDYLEIFCFSSPPTSPDCMVAGFKSYGASHVYIHFVSQGSTWHQYALDFGGDPYSYQFPSFSGPDIYALSNNEVLEVFKDFTIDNYGWKVVLGKAPRSCHCKSSARYFLSNCDQHRLLVIVGEFGESVEVFRHNESTLEWEKIDELGTHMIYISNTSCICLEVASPEMGNKIFFPRLLQDDTKIVFYFLETCRYHTFDGKIIEESLGADFFGTKQHCYPHTWIEPSWC